MIKKRCLRGHSEYVRKNIIIPKLLRDPGEGLQSLDSIANYSIMKAGERGRVCCCVAYLLCMAWQVLLQKNSPASKL